MLVFTGIKNTSPSLFIIHNFVKNKKFTKKKLKEIFIKQQFTEKRLYENLQKNLLKKNNKKLLLSKKGKIFMNIFLKLKTLYNL